MIPIEFRAQYTARAGKEKKICKFDLTMPDNTYNVAVEFAHYAGNYAITDKSATQCTVTFSNAPASDVDFSIIVYYSEDALA